MRQEVVDKIKKVLELQQDRAAMEKSLETQKYSLEVINSKLDRLLNVDTTNFGVGPNVRECFVSIDNSIVEIRFINANPPTVSIRKISIEHPECK